MVRVRDRESPPVEHHDAVFSHLTLWIDGVGGYLLWNKPELILGQASPAGSADLGIMGDISRKSLALRRAARDCFLEPFQPLRVNTQEIARPHLLRHGDLIEVGSAVQVRFEQPHVLSATARLEKVSLHRWQPSVAAVLLLADSCIIGPRAGSHILCSTWENEITLIQQAGNWWLRTTRDVEVNNQMIQGPVAIGPGLRLRNDNFSLSFE